MKAGSWSNRDTSNLSAANCLMPSIDCAIAVSANAPDSRANHPKVPDTPGEILPVEEFTYLEPGRWNGTLRQTRLPHIKAYRANADPAHCNGPGAESFETLQVRVDCTLQRLQALGDGATVYAFSDGQFLQAVRLRLMHPTWTAQQKIAHLALQC